MNIIRLSDPQSVSMSSGWFDISHADHFWIKHRERLITKFFGIEIENAQAIAEIGCGNGLILSAISKKFDKSVDGFDLNEYALNQCVPFNGQLYYYDILDRHPDLESKFDLLFLLDVLEHIEDEYTFLNAIYWHLKPGGKIIINVPCNSSLYSKYDEAAGHFRRYDIPHLMTVLKNANLSPIIHINWGYVFVPVILLRKLIVSLVPSHRVIDTGFKSGKLTNIFFAALGRLDFNTKWIFPGTSVLVCAQKST